jgi:hypothetical protein
MIERPRGELTLLEEEIIRYYSNSGSLGCDLPQIQFRGNLIEALVPTTRVLVKTIGRFLFFTFAVTGIAYKFRTAICSNPVCLLKSGKLFVEFGIPKSING